MHSCCAAAPARTRWNKSCVAVEAHVAICDGRRLWPTTISTRLVAGPICRLGRSSAAPPAATYFEGGLVRLLRGPWPPAAQKEHRPSWPRTATFMVAAQSESQSQSAQRPSSGRQDRRPTVLVVVMTATEMARSRPNSTFRDPFDGCCASVTTRGRVSGPDARRVKAAVGVDEGSNIGIHAVAGVGQHGATAPVSPSVGAAGRQLVGH